MVSLPTVWVLHGGRGSLAEPGVLSWPDSGAGDLRLLGALDAIRDRLALTLSDQPLVERSQLSLFLSRFLHELKPGDFVLESGTRTLVAVTGEYAYVGGRHVRPVRTVRPFRDDELSTALRDALQVCGQLLFTANGHRREVLRLAGAETEQEPRVAPPSPPESAPVRPPPVEPALPPWGTEPLVSLLLAALSFVVWSLVMGPLMLLLGFADPFGRGGDYVSGTLMLGAVTSIFLARVRPRRFFYILRGPCCLFVAAIPLGLASMLGVQSLDECVLALVTPVVCGVCAPLAVLASAAAAGVQGVLICMSCGAPQAAGDICTSCGRAMRARMTAGLGCTGAVISFVLGLTVGIVAVVLLLGITFRGLGAQGGLR